MSVFRFSIFLTSLILISASVIAQQEKPTVFIWPVGQSEFPRVKGITSSFGESRIDHFHSGLDIAGALSPVAAPADGKVLFHQMADHNPFYPESGAGNFAVIDHGKGVWSGFYHLTEISIPTRDVKQGQIIAKSGNTGHSYGAHLHFFITENYGKTYLNPLNVIGTPEDNRPPVIGQIEIHINDHITHLSYPAPQQIRLTRNYPFEIFIFDPGMEPWGRRGVYRLKWKLNEDPWEERVFSKISLHPEGWLINDKYSFGEVFIGQNYSLGDLKLIQGENTITVEAEDYNGNKSTALFTIQIQKEF
jgi:hypothetical protein